MLFSTVTLLFGSLAALATGMPLDKRAGPSGSVVEPAGGTNVPSSQGYPTARIPFVYKPVNESKDGDCGGYGCSANTWYVSVALRDEDGNETMLAERLGGSAVDKNIETYLIAPANSCGDFTLVVHEYQNLYGEDIDFQSAAPAITIGCDPVP